MKTPPKAKCRVFSGFECDVLADASQSHCGNPMHPFVLVHLREAPDVLSVPTPTPRKPKLVVDEDFDVVEMEVESLDGKFNPNELIVSQAAQRAFTRRHRVEPEIAIAEIRLVVTRALEAGKIQRQSNGTHCADIKQYRVVLSPGGVTAVAYSTLHHERLPSQVFSGVPSRFGVHRQSPLRVDGPPIPIDEIGGRIHAQKIKIANPAIFRFRKAVSTDLTDEDAESRIREMLAVDLLAGRWESTERATSYALVGGIHWIISADGDAVVTIVPEVTDDEPA